MHIFKNTSVALASIFLTCCTSTSATSSDVDKLASAGSNTQLYSPLSDPSNTGSWVYQTDLSDEFNGDSFDRSVWHNMGEDGDYKGQWKGRAPSQYNPENIRVENGNL